jgi:hypothetical protein
MENEVKTGDTLFYLGKTKEEELINNFDEIYDVYRLLAHKKGFSGEIKFVESLDNIYIYVKII